MHVAHVKNGRLVLDEPTDLAEGSAVPLEIADDWDELDDEERAALHRELAASIAERKAGAGTYSVEEVRLRASLFGESSCPGPNGMFTIRSTKQLTRS